MSNPFAGVQLYVDPNSLARQWCSHHPTDPSAAVIRPIADTPQAFWLGSWSGDVRHFVMQVMNAAAGQFVVFVVYGIPAWGGNLPLYKQFINAIAAGVGGKAAFIIEPDGLAESTAHDAHLEYAIQTLSAVGATYLDMGHSGWNSASTMAARYGGLGTSANRGFSLNVSNFRTDGELQGYAAELHNATGKPSVTDTSRNGNGPDSNDEWCNPSGRALGQLPLQVSNGAIDANLWIKRPGESDGICNGGPAAGQFWPEYAVGLAQS